MKNLKKEKKKLATLKKEYRKQLDLVEELKESQLLPEAIKNYEGKYFRERNSYGSCINEDEWFAYYFVKKVINPDRCECISIQLIPDGKLEVKNKEYFFLSMMENEITKEDFLKEISTHEKYFSDTINLMKK